MSRLNTYLPEASLYNENTKGPDAKEISRITNGGTGGLRCCSTFCTGYTNRERYDYHVHHSNSDFHYRGASAEHRNGDIPSVVVYKQFKWYCGQCKLQDQWVFEHEELPDYRTHSRKCRHICICQHVHTSFGNYGLGSGRAERYVADLTNSNRSDRWSWTWFSRWYKQRFPTSRLCYNLPSNQIAMQDFVSAEDYIEWRLHNLDLDPEPRLKWVKEESETEEGKENIFDGLFNSDGSSSE